ncbi:hypothetical protein KIM372_11030 [Bombiscardovia nodaiensis]|uniref:Uncharacterized protein n=1 Tax=Bombiscardovia nodaiensis TaxID=2932181 RepID=A0ABN6SEG9_9BIFI|nr:hypothetical protein KIM372_11030 [Bombiscardovia nodaiensis]
MQLPEHIPTGSRVVVRVAAGLGQTDGRMKFCDYIGHVTSWDGQTLHLLRDPAANGSRPEQAIRLPADSIVALKPIPERQYPFGRRDGSSPETAKERD